MRQDGIAAVFTYGQRYRSDPGAYVLYLTQRAVKAARKHGLRLEKYQNLALVVSQDGAVLTVYYATRPQRHWTPE